MPIIADAGRRWLGIACLILATGLLVCGETLLKGRLGGMGFLAYWLACFCFTLLAIGCALLETRAVRRQTREEHRALFEQTLHEIQQAGARKAKITTNRKEP